MKNAHEEETAASFWHEEVLYISSRDVVSVPLGTATEKAVALMDERSVGYVLVTQPDGSLAGIVTTSDLMHDFVDSTMGEDTPIESFMQTELVTVRPEATVSDVAGIFHANGVQHLPVVRADGTLAGLVSVSEMMTFIAEHQPHEVLNRPPDSRITLRKKEGV